jgi:hypothetical protein
MRRVEILPPIAALVTTKHSERRWILASLATFLGLGGIFFTRPILYSDVHALLFTGRYAWFIIWVLVFIFSILLWKDYIKLSKNYIPGEAFQRFRIKKKIFYRISSVVFGLLSVLFVVLAIRVLFFNTSHISRDIISPILGGMVFWLLARVSFFLYRAFGGKTSAPVDPQYLSLWRGVPDWGGRDPLALTSNLVNPFETPRIGHDCILALHADGLVLLYRSETGWEPVSFEFSALSAVAMAADYGDYYISVKAVIILLRFDGGREAILTLPSAMDPQHSFVNALLVALDEFIDIASDTVDPIVPLPEPQRWVFARMRSAA